MKKNEKTYFVVAETWFNEQECPATRNGIVNVCNTLEDAQASMEDAFQDASGDLRDPDELSAFTDTHEERICAFDSKDGSVWYECRIVELAKWFEDGDELDERIVVKDPTMI